MATTDYSLERGLPASVDAERSILGAILLDNFAYTQSASQNLQADDFSLDSHRRIYSRIHELADTGRAIDLVTLAEELSRHKEVEAVGGVAYLSSLTDGLPHRPNIEQYVRIVKDKALLRGLIFAANAAVARAMDEAEPADDVLNSAEAALYQLSENRFTRDFQDVKQIVRESFGSLDELFDRAHRVTGLETHFSEFDAMTSGLQRSDLVIIAARPSMGKTALALNIAESAAVVDGKVVGVFSLEMSREALLLRLLCSNARVDSHRLRTGFESREDRERLVKALGRLAEAPIYIDDTPGITVSEMRAKARRLQHQHQGKLDLLIVDYLQLMSGTPPGGKRYENRTQEVSAISRGLKLLAKELRVPVMALSQLSRAPESRGKDHRPQLSDLRESGCLTGDTLVTLAGTGERVPIAQLVGRTDFSVWALDEKTLHFTACAVERVFATGTKPVYRLTTRLGRTIRATANHKFLSFGGWKRLDEVRPGDRLALPRSVPAAGRDSMTEAELALLAHLIGDGCTLPRHVIQYTTTERDLAESVAGWARQLFGDQVEPRINPERRWLQVYLSSTRHHTHGVGSAVGDWLRLLGIWGLRSFEKRIPSKVFQQTPGAIAVFLRHLWSTDGCIHLRAGKRSHPAVYYATSSHLLACDVQSALLRLNINARITRIAQKNKGRDQFHVSVSGRPDLLRFVSTVGAFGARKSEILRRMRSQLLETRHNTNRDVIPSVVWKNLVVPAMRKARVTTRQLSAAIQTAYCGTTLYRQNLSRERAARVAGAVQCEELLRLAQSEVYWDEVASIVPDTTEPVFDITVPGHHNFLANDTVVHNSIEQDADVVAFLYRGEVYDMDNPDLQGKAELIVAKQRNGPTGKIELAFSGKFTRFDNLEEREAPEGN